VIFVEDKLAVAVVKRAMRLLDDAAHARARIEVLPGGADEIQAHTIPVLALSGAECLVLLDGDQRKSFPGSVDDVPTVELRKTAEAMLGSPPRLPLSGGADGHSEEEEGEQLRKVIGWALAHVAYLPGNDPESLIFSLLGEPIPPGEAKGAKEEWVERTRKALGKKEWEKVTSAEILAEEDRALALVSDNSPELVQLSQRLSDFLR
jgi:hypothetical protein